MTLSVTDRQSDVFPNIRKLLQSTSKNVSKFVSERGMGLFGLIMAVLLVVIGHRPCM